MDNPFIHPDALVEKGAKIGRKTRVWAFAHILGGAQIGENCNICDHTFVEGQVRIGNRVTVKCGVYLWDGLVVEDDVFIGPCVAFTNDLRPRSRSAIQEYPVTLLRRGASIGANATILPGLTIGKWAMVGAGSVVTHSVPDFALVLGSPARRVGWVCRCGKKLAETLMGEVSCPCGLVYREASADSLCEVETGGSGKHTKKAIVSGADLN